jgi:hypothetical protein
MMTQSSDPRVPSTFEVTLRDLQNIWIRKNRGVMTRLIRDTGYSGNAIRSTLFGLTNSPNPDIARALRREGAPGFAEEMPPKRRVA